MFRSSPKTSSSFHNARSTGELNMTEPALLSSTDRSGRSARFFNRLHRYRNVGRRLWWVMPLTVALALGVQFFRLRLAPPAYVSQGRMIVSIKIQIPTGSVYTEEFSNFLGTQVALMRSSTVMNRALERVRALKPDLAPAPVDLQISVSPKTTIFNLQATGASPEFTRIYLDACMEEYISLKKEMRTSTSETTLAGITEQLVTLERELKKNEDDLIQFQASNSVVFLQEQDKSGNSYLVQLNRQLALLRTESQLLNLLDLDQNLERQQKDTGLLAATGSGSDTDRTVNFLHSDYLKAKQEIQLKKAELQEWSEYLRPKHPRMVALTEEVTRREKLLEIFRQQNLEQLENRRNSISLQVENLEREIKDWETKSLDISKKMAEYERIRSNKQRVQNLYDRLLGTVQNLGVDKDINPESVTVLERASAPREARASAAKTLVIAGLIGLLVGLGILLAVDRLDDRPTSFTELQDEFDEPILGQIPLEATRGRNNSNGLLEPEDDRHAFMEAYRNLRSSLLYMATEGKRPRTILVTSAVPGDGKSMTASNLAITIAHAGSRVLLVDADLRKGLLHRNFNLSPTPGLNEVLTQQSGPAQAIQPTATPNLFLLPRGNTSRNPGEMFLHQKTVALLNHLASQYDYVIVDSAPVMAADDVASLSPQIEGVVFVVRAATTSARVARAALDILYQREVDVLGLVFNAVESNASDYYYYRYKDYYAPRTSA
jgi:capsular exopolysaccharide synthesis family protein